MMKETKGEYEMKRALLIIGLLLLVISSFPIFLMVRETMTWNKMDEQYEVQNADMYQAYTTPATLLGQSIQFVETPTGKLAEKTVFDEMDGVEPGEYIFLQLVVNGEPVASEMEIALSNHDYNPRYYSWVEIHTVKAKATGEERIAIVQRLSPDDALMENREWRVIWVDAAGEIEEVSIPYAERSQHLVETYLIQRGSTPLVSVGFYSDIRHYYPSLFFPILYPAGSVMLGLIFIAIAGCMQIMARFKRRKGGTVNARSSI